MGLRKLWKSWRLRGCVEALVICEEALSSIRGALAFHEDRLEMYRQNPLLGEPKWREFHEYCQGRETYWMQRIQEWKTREERTKWQYVFLAVVFMTTGVFILWRITC